MKSALLPIGLLLASVSPAIAQNSAPQPLPIVDTIPAARDVDYPGTMLLDIDATDTQRGIFEVKQTIPVAAAGPMALLFPKWLPGNHAPRGEIEKLAGLEIHANGKKLNWERDDVDVYAFHIDVPEGARSLDVRFRFISATNSDQGRVVMTPAIINLQWEKVSLYPAGWYTRRIPVKANVRYPSGWKAASGLPSRFVGGVYQYETTSYETLIDSPVFAGRYMRQEQLSPKVRLNIVADEARYLAAKPEQIEAHRKLVDQAVKLFGAQHYDNYEFLLSLSDELGGIGLEHHRSSENGVKPGYFLDWDAGPGSRNLLPHEFTHSWNGKYRRGADLFTPDFRTPMRNSLLWVYEGQTQFWGYVLQARSGLVSKQDTLDAYAVIAAQLDNRPARGWRDLEDTTNDPVISARRPKGWLSYQRSEDYYNEGLLVWMEVDSMLRAQTRGARGLDDFAKAFFGQKDGDWGVSPYTIEDVAATLNGIAPYDWLAFLQQRLNENAAGAPLKGFTNSGYSLVYTEEPTPVINNQQKTGDYTDFFYSLGLNVAKGNKVNAVLWDGPAFKQGVTVSDELIAVNGHAYSAEELKAAITAAKTGKDPIRLLVRSGDRFREVAIDYHDGLRYPRFRKTGTQSTALDKLLEAR
ncbi:putative metalloprotease with PDZ domain [Sphingomonas zeicaulis]|uniref:M61 family metallopeptidase n=1 Tax=Sphingomonas zeicaulis TaxID=1632740 RepID=UPI003D1A7321